MQNQKTLFENETQKHFTYLGYTFYPVRQFTEKENRLGLKLPICYLKKDRLKYMDKLFNHSDFYKAAEAIQADTIDIFKMADGMLVVPCTFSLQEYEITKLNEYI